MGAPNAESGQPGVEKGGAVYKCKPDSPGSCDLIPFDTKGEKKPIIYHPRLRGHEAYIKMETSVLVQSLKSSILS